MSRKRLVTLSGIAAATAFPLLADMDMNAHAATGPTVTINGSASMTVIVPLSVNTTSALTFGEFVITPAGGGGNGGACAMATNATISCAAAGGDVKSVSGSGQLGKFSVSGEANHSITFSVTAATFKLDEVGTGTDQVTLSSFNITNTGGSNPMTGSSTSLEINSNIVFEADDAAGSYTGTYTIKVAYN